MTPPSGGARKGTGAKALKHKRRLLSFRCSEKDWKVLKEWRSGDAAARAKDVLRMIRNGNDYET